MSLLCPPPPFPDFFILFDGFPKNLFHYLVRGAGGSRSGVQGGGGNHGAGRGSQRGTYLGRGMWMGKNLL